MSDFVSAVGPRGEYRDSLAQLLDELDRELRPVSREDLAWADAALGLDTRE